MAKQEGAEFIPAELLGWTALPFQSGWDDIAGIFPMAGKKVYIPEVQEDEDWEAEIADYEKELLLKRRELEREELKKRSSDLYQRVLTHSRLGVNKKLKKILLKNWFEGWGLDTIQEVSD